MKEKPKWRSVVILVGAEENGVWGGHAAPSCYQSN